MNYINVDDLVNQLELWKDCSVGYENWVLGRVINVVKNQKIISDENDKSEKD